MQRQPDMREQPSITRLNSAVSVKKHRSGRQTAAHLARSGGTTPRNYLTASIAVDVRTFPGNRCMGLKDRRSPHHVQAQPDCVGARSPIRPTHYEEDNIMNISITNYEDLLNEFSSETTFEKTERKSASSSGRKFQKKRKSPQQFNGIHRRRKKQIRW